MTKTLGKGGFAYWVKYTDEIDGNQYAMKVIPKVIKGKLRSVEKINNEISILADMDHPNVVKMVRYFEDEENVNIIMEFWENKTTVELIKARKRLTEAEVRWYIAQLTEGIKYIHSMKIIHRDIKPGNLFLAKNMQLKIGDFGLSERVYYEGDFK